MVINKILIALALAVVMSGNAYAENKTDKGIHYICNYMAIHVYKDRDSLVEWVDITGTIIEEKFATTVEPFKLILSPELYERIYTPPKKRTGAIFTVNRKTLSIYQSNGFLRGYGLRGSGPTEMGKRPNSCKLDEAEVTKKRLDEIAEKIRIKYENKIKY
jgi:hypothetical protein